MSSESSINSSDCGSSSSTSTSILNKLRPPTISDLARKRKILVNIPPVGKRRSTTTVKKFDPKSVKPSDRVSEFPGEQLSQSAGRLFCKTCREDVAVKRSVVVNHIKSKKHEDGKKRLKRKELRERDIAESLRAHDNETHCKGETLPEAQNVYRARVVITFMKCGIPLAKLDCSDLRCLLEENGYRLADSRSLMDMIPFVLSEERAQIRSELSGKCLSVIFDGTTRLGEVLAIVVRFADGWAVKQCLVRLEFLQKSVNSEELAREIISVLSVTLGIDSNRLLGAMHDRASVNCAAMRTVKVMYPLLIYIGCLSHTLDLVEEKFKLPTANHFITLWISLFAHSSKVKALWKLRTDGIAMSSYSKTRWWSRWEVMEQVINQFGSIHPFLVENPDISPATRQHLMDILNDPKQLLILKLELAVVIDVGAFFVRGTYNLEGDDALVLTCYEEILKIR